ncbi:hypothetical protein QAD02_005069, partial [Eretmocerus hayati]
RPQPRVRWLINGELKKDDSLSNGGDVIEKKLSVKPLNRSHLLSNFTCQAQNTRLVEPKQASIMLDMNLKPLTVKIKQREGHRAESPLKAGARYEMECETTGSRPPAVITWYKGTHPLMHVKVSLHVKLDVTMNTP